VNAVAAPEAPAGAAGSGTDQAAGARRIAEAFAAARADSRTALIRTSSPDTRTRRRASV
jgi:hypothetical protein